jgi:hypothetical protein
VYLKETYLYHATPRENVKAILSGGLRDYSRDKDEDSNIRRKGYICLSKNPHTWRSDNDALFHVNVSGMEELGIHIKDWSQEPDPEYNQTDEVCIWVGEISANRLKLAGR